MTAEEQARLEHGIEEFNARLFFECHDTLEELWSGLGGEARDVVQGLIQVAVGFYHLDNGNRAGAARLFDRGLARLRRHGERCCGVEVALLAAAVAPWQDAAQGGGELPSSEPPVIVRATSGLPAAGEGPR